MNRQGLDAILAKTLKKELWLFFTLIGLISQTFTELG